jgi:hypothetical protein
LELLTVLTRDGISDHVAAYPSKTQKLNKCREKVLQSAVIPAGNIDIPKGHWTKTGFSVDVKRTMEGESS